MTAQRLFIIDAMALAYRSFFAFGRTSLSTSQGIPTGAIYGTAMFLNKLVTEQRPDYLVAVTDSPGPTFRHEMYKEYKATRDKMPDDLAKQIAPIFELVERFRCKVINIPGVEADDVIATLAKAHAGPKLDAYIVSGDKDFMQIVNRHIYMYAPKKNEEALLIDEAGVKERYGCTPDQIIDLLALVGDSVDNVPGVKGIGEKGAAKLIETYGSLEGIYAHLDQITAKKQKEGLESSKADAFLSRQLVTLKTDVEMPYALDDFKVVPTEAAANEQLLEFYRRYEFKMLANKVAAKIPQGAQEPGAAKGGTPAPVVVEATHANVTVVSTGVAEKAFVEAVRQAQRISLVVAASGSDIAADKATTLTVGTGESQVFQLPLTEEGIYFARAAFADQKKLIIGHGLKIASQMLYNVGLDLGRSIVDLEVCDYLIDPNNYNHTLEALNERYGDGQTVDFKNDADAAAAMLKLYDAIMPRITSLGLTKVLNEIEMPLIPVLASMEREGFYVDAEMLDAYSSDLSVLADKLEKELYAAAGEEFNVNSPKQLQEVLFEKLKLQEEAGIKRLKRTKTGLSTDESVLTRLAAVHPVPKLILEYRTVTKLKNTYVDPLPQFINPKTGRLHTSLRQTVAATGRLSSDRPNLQNIPMRTDLGRKIRQAFKPQDQNSLLISADYSQVELRLLAHLAGDKGMIEAFKHGLDVHTVTAAKIFRVPEKEVDSVLRSRAKAVNFGIIYGMGPQRLSQETGTTLTEAKDFIARYFEVYPRIKEYTESLIASARELGYCVTIMGRRRPIPEIRESNQAVLARGENIAVNAPIQGSAADLIKLAMIRVDAELRKHYRKSRLLLQVHDELVLSAPKEDTPAVMEVVRTCMEHAIETSVPLKVDVRSGRTWLEAHG